MSTDDDSSDTRAEQIALAERRRLRWDITVFEPKVRVFFDTGNDGVGEIDIFDDGGLTAAVNFAEFTYMSIINAENEWTAGPAFGIGLTAPAGGSDDGSTNASGAPVVLFSLGLRGEFPFGEKEAYKDQEPTFLALEIGYAYGITSSEDVAGSDEAGDGAIYIGFSLEL